MQTTSPSFNIIIFLGLLLTMMPMSAMAASQPQVKHGTNLIWAQTPQGKLYTVSRLVAIQGDPSIWTVNRKPEVTYISAPHFTWEFKSVGFHWAEETLYWSEGMNKKIQSLVLNSSTDTRTLFSGTSPEVYGIAVDWLSQNVYFTDTLYDWIMMIPSRSTQSAYRIVVQDKLDAPHGIAVYPQKGYLIWSDCGERPRIEIGDLLGGNRRTLVERDIVKPRGLAIDYQGNALFWVDSFKATVETIQFNGQNRRLIHQEEGLSFYGVALYNNFIFVAEKSRGMLKVFNDRQSVVSFTLGNYPTDIIMYDGSQQPGNSTECEDMGCDHFCILDPLTGPKCLCGEGYVSEGSTSCKPTMKFVHPSHIYAIKDSICQYPANLADMSLTNVTLDSQCFLEDRQGYMTLTFDARENMLYYFGNNTKTISRIPLEMGGKGKVLTGGTGVVKGMALDWVAGNLYWTDSTNGHIAVATKTGVYQSIILDNLSNPMGIAVHPGRGKIFWTDQGHLPEIGAKVEKANLDGTNRELIMADNIGEPNHIFIDFKTDSVYWADSILHHVRQLNLNTNRISVVYEQDNVKFYGISFFKDFILWTDTEDLNGIHIARMDKKEKVRGIIHPRNGLAADLITFDIQAQPSFNNSCAESNSRCSQLCLLTEGNVSKCTCGVGYELLTDEITCHTTTELDHFILVNDAFQKQIFQVSLKTAMVSAVDLQPAHEPIAISYDPFEFRVFWSDNKANVIKEASLNGRNEKTVMLFNNISMCDGLAVDYINKLLFFTDTGNKVIGVVSLRDYRLYTYIVNSNLEEPRDIVVSPNQGLIYWSDWGLNSRIERANMDGSDRKTIVLFNTVAWPNGIALDLQENKLYWVDAHADKISYVDLSNNEIVTLIEDQGSHYFSVDVVGEYLYVADWKKNYLRRMNKRGGTLTQFGPANFTRLYGIKGHNSSETFKGVSVCVGSICNHLCLPKQGGTYICRCAEGYDTQGPNCNKKTTTEEPLTLPMGTFSTLESENSSSPISTPSSSSSSTTPSNSSSPSSSTSTSTSEPPGTTPIPNTSWLYTTEPTDVITPTKMPVTMETSEGSEFTSPDSWATNTVIHSGVGESTVTINISINSNGTVAKSSKSAESYHLSAAIMGVIIASAIIALILLILAAAVYLRHRQYHIRHGKLTEEKNPANFYKIAFPARGEDTVTFDTGIENPTYDCLHDPTNIMAPHSEYPNT